jgi:hypothetical protein
VNHIVPLTVAPSAGPVMKTLNVPLPLIVNVSAFDV